MHAAFAVEHLSLVIDDAAALALTYAATAERMRGSGLSTHRRHGKRALDVAGAGGLRDRAQGLVHAGINRLLGDARPFHLRRVAVENDTALRVVMRHHEKGVEAL